MGPLLSALLALMAMGTMAHFGFEPRHVCTSKQKSVLKQQAYLKRQLTRFQWQVTSLRTTCHLEIPDILGLKPFPPGTPESPTNPSDTTTPSGSIPPNPWIEWPPNNPNIPGNTPPPGSDGGPPNKPNSTPGHPGGPPGHPGGPPGNEHPSPGHPGGPPGNEHPSPGHPGGPPGNNYPPPGHPGGPPGNNYPPPGHPGGPPGSPGGPPGNNYPPPGHPGGPPGNNYPPPGPPGGPPGNNYPSPGSPGGPPGSPGGPPGNNYPTPAYPGGPPGNNYPSPAYPGGPPGNNYPSPAYPGGPPGDHNGTPQFPIGTPGINYFPNGFPPGYPGYPPGIPAYPGVPDVVWTPGVTTEINMFPIIDYYLNAKDVEEDSKLTTVMIIKKYRYPVETHFVTTPDGYILCLHRIPRPGAPVILMVHGLMSSSVIWVQMGPSNGLAFKLYNQGYDVWMLNTRGNIYSQQHKNPNIKPSVYWAFSFHEIGVLDLPATIDMVISVSKQPQIQYIGHSQGSTSFFVMCSELPQYADKIILMQALSPTVFMQNTQSPVLRFLNLFKGKFGVLLNLLGGLEISRDNTLIAQFRNHICSANIGSQICAIFDFVMCGFGWSEFNTNLTQLVVGHSSQGASSIQIYHYAQLLNGPKFHRFDKGALINSMTYKGSDPPSYNLTSCTCKVALHYAEDDWLAGPQDVATLKDRLPNVVDNSFIPQKGFCHYDYMLSKNVNRLLYGRVINNVIMNRYIFTTQTQTFVQPVIYQYQQII
ncbi:hypothetical protein ACLKA7_003656 [Drosophila subpalustris]